MLVALPALLLGGAAAAQAPCPATRQPMPPAINSIGTLAIPADTIAFAATPWEFPGRAWVVRLWRRGAQARLEIVRLRRRFDCNVWDLETRWEAPAALADFTATAEAIAPWMTVPPGFPDRRNPSEITLDGTALELLVGTGGWRIDRALNHYGERGAALSAIFRRLVERLVPSDELPADDWRTRGAP